MVQGMAVLDDEDHKNCTEMLLGFSQPKGVKLRDWAAQLEKRGAKTRGPIFNLQSKGAWMAQDALNFRISSPLNPHGSPGLATMVRRALMPCRVTDLVPSPSSLEYLPDTDVDAQVAPGLVY